MCCGDHCDTKDDEKNGAFQIYGILATFFKKEEQCFGILS
jgi:hypothetical protein